MRSIAAPRRGIAALFLAAFIQLSGVSATETPATRSSAERITSAQAWTAEVMRRLSAQTFYPAAARARGLEGLTVVRMEINAGGQLTAIAVLESSGSQMLDEAALTIATNAAPFPSPNFDVEYEIWRIDLPVRFQLSDPPAVEPRCPAKKTSKGAGILDGNC